MYCIYGSKKDISRPLVWVAEKGDLVNNIGMISAMRLTLLFGAFLLAGCSHVFYQPSNLYYYDPVENGFEKPEDIDFQSKDGTPIWGWFFKAHGKKTAKGTIIQFHGNGQNLTAHYTFLAWLTREGYNLFAFDYRGYGKALGKPTQEGTYLDGIAALEKAWELHQKHSPKGNFVVVGQSLGGAIAMRAVGDFSKTHKVDKLVLDSTFLNYRTVAVKFAAKKWFLWPFLWIPWIAVSNAYGAADQLEENKIPLLVTHDHRDPIIPFSCGEEIFEDAKSEKVFWKFDQGRHTGAFAEANKWDRSYFLDWLAR